MRQGFQPRLDYRANRGLWALAHLEKPGFYDFYRQQRSIVISNKCDTEVSS